MDRMETSGTAGAVTFAKHDGIVEGTPWVSPRSDNDQASFYMQRVIMGGGHVSLEDLEEVLKAMDEDRSGHISFEELFNGLCKCGLNPSRDATEQIFDEIDYDKSGTITCDELKEYFNELDEYAQLQRNKKRVAQCFCHCSFLADSVGIFLMVLLLYEWREDKYGAKKQMYALVNNVMIGCGVMWFPLFAYAVGWPLLKTVYRSCRQPKAPNSLKARRSRLSRSQRRSTVGVDLKSPDSNATFLSRTPAPPTIEANRLANGQSPLIRGEDAHPPEAHPLSVPAPDGLPEMLPLDAVPGNEFAQQQGDLATPAVANTAPTSPSGVPRHVAEVKEVGRRYDPLDYAKAITRQMQLQPAVHFNPLAQCNGGPFQQKVLPPVRGRHRVMELS